MIFNNRNLFEYLGYKNTDFKNQSKIIEHIGELMNQKEFIALQTHNEKVFQSKKNKTFDFEFRLKNKHNEWQWFLRKDLVFKRDLEGTPSEILVTISDISKVKEAEEKRQIAKIEAEKSAKIKAEFLSNMSHEIRTPMNAIIGLSEIILNEKLEEDVEDNMNSILQSAQNLLVIINDILDLSKLEAGKMKIESIPFNLT
ncbi:MAG: PAS domain-containing protein [Bacteroidales bacterium]|nr:PAS domain-containing protein [Bacteroidales bacterium]